MQPASDKVRTVTLLKRGALVFLTLGAIVLAFQFFRSGDSAAPPMRPLTIAVPAQINSAPMLVASAQGLFQQAGVSVTSQAFELGKDALKSLLEGRADLAVVADTPLMFALLDGADIAMLAGISQARATLAIVTRKDRGIVQMQDLRGKSIGVTLGTNLTYFLDAMLQVHGVPSEQVTLADLRSDEISSAFKAGGIDAAVVYHPYLARLKGEMGERIKVFHGEDVYAFRFILVGKPAYIDSHPQEIQRVLRALLAANRAIRADPVAARRAVGAALKIDDATMAEMFDPEDYTVSLDQAMLLALDDQTRWAMQKGLVRTRPMPNYLHAMKYQNLEAVLPSAVTIVH